MIRGAALAARTAQVVHHVPGRLRFRIAGARDEAAFFEGVRRFLVGLSGVESVRVNAASSSVVVRYAANDRGFAGRLGHQLEQVDWLRMESELPTRPDPVPMRGGGLAFEPPPLASHSHLARAVVATSSRLDDGLRQATGGYLDLKVLMPLLLAGAGQFSQRRQQGTPMWMTLAIFAFNSFVSLHRIRFEAQAAVALADTQPAQIHLRPSRPA